MKTIFSVFIFTGFIVLGSYSCKLKNQTNRADAKDEARIEVGVALYSFNPFSISESLAKSKEAGANLVEGFFFHKLGGKYGDRLIVNLSDEEVQELKSEISASGMAFKSLYAGGKTVEEWDQMFRVCQQLGGEFLVGEPEPELWDGINALAERYSMKLAIHEHAKGRSRFWHPDSVLLAIKGHANFGACADLGHWTRSGLDPVECLQKLEGHIISVHAKDLDEFGNVDANDVRIGDGVIIYEEVVRELERQRFSGPIYIECEHDPENNVEDVKDAVAYIRKLAESVEK